MKPVKETILDRLRSICLAFPEAIQGAGVSEVNFRVRDKIFVMYMDDHHGDGRLAIWCKAPPGAQDLLVSADPDRYFVPPYVGHHGWVGVRLDREIDWEEIAGLAEDSYRMTAPKRVSAQLAARQ